MSSSGNLNLTLRPDGPRVKNNALAIDAAAGAQLPRRRLNIIMNIIKAIGRAWGNYES
jgi:hypothetical protein